MAQQPSPTLLQSRHRPISADTAFIKRLVRVAGGFFPAGAPIPTASFMAGMIELLDAHFCSLTLVRNDPRRKALVAFDNISYNMHGDRLARHRQNMTNKKAWDTDPVAHRLLARSKRHPLVAFTFSTRRWLARFGWENSFTRKMLDAAGWHSNLTALIPLDRQVFALLSVGRSEPGRFSRLDARVLLQMTKQYHRRLIELRSRSLREALPTTLRATFDLILAGLSEKEIARSKRQTAHTVHDQIKRLYSHFGVNSRAQLMAKYIDAEKVRSAES